MDQKRLLLKNAVVIDGTGDERRRHDVLLADGKIAQVAPPGSLETSEGDEVIECEQDWIAAPGFVDPHSHGDFALFYDHAQKAKLFQGITTEIEGNCGISAAPVDSKHADQLISYTAFLGSEKSIPVEKLSEFKKFSDYLKAAESLKLGINPGFLIGHGTVRVAAMGMDNRKASTKELEKMKKYVAEAMESGALGMSTGLIYPPGVFAGTDELVELCKVVASYGGIYTTHLRNESYRMPEAVAEAIDVARRANCRLMISHHKVCAREKWGETSISLKMIEDANAEGLFVRADAYPYTASCTTTTSLIPPEFHDGGVTNLIKRLKDKEDRERIIARFHSDDRDWDNSFQASGFENIYIIDGAKTPDAIGKSVTDYAKLRGLPDMDALFEVLIENNGESTCVEFCMDEEEVERVLAHPLTMVGSDSGVDLPGVRVHPRTTGSFPRVLGWYTRERKIFTLEEAVRKMSGAPAETFKLKNKGFLQEGHDADIVLFNHKTVAAKSDYNDSAQYPEGIEYVILGGRIAVKSNILKGAPGHVIKHEHERR